MITQVGVLLRNDLVFHVGLDRELDDGQLADRALGRAGEEPVGGGKDGDPVKLALAVGPEGGRDTDRDFMIRYSGR